MNFEHFVISDELGNNFINSIVKLNIFFFFIVHSFEYGMWLLRCFSKIFFHVEKKLEQQLWNTQILTDHLLHF